MSGNGWVFSGTLAIVVSCGNLFGCALGFTRVHTCAVLVVVFVESTPRTLRSGAPPKYVKTWNRLETSQIPSDVDKNWCKLRFCPRRL
jgi:hypothetical protein